MEKIYAAENSTGNIAKGRIGEEACAEEYEKRGYRIVARNWRRGRIGEIDIVAESPEKRILCFCEVKTRKSSDFARASEAVDYKKRLRIRKLAQLFLLERPYFSDRYVRFDIAEVYCSSEEGREGRELKTDIIEAAF